MASTALTLLGDIQTEGRDVVIGMLIVLGELAGWMAHRRR